jgi:hypothetical protein
MPTLSLIRRPLPFALLAATALLAAAQPRVQAQPRAQAQPRPLAAAEMTGPFTHENLAVFLIHDKTAQTAHADENVLTLEEALKTGAVVIEETGNVNELVASNKGDQAVFLQAGDVVKGGRQDRTLQRDVLLPAKTRKLPLAAFCVESGRWSGRGNEPSQHFASSSRTLPTRKAKLAAKLKANQSEVWQAVEETQANLATKVGHTVKAGASETSLQLSLEDRSLNAAADRYVAAIEAQLPARNDVVGYAFAVNGQVSAVDTYASPALFRKMRAKLLRASAIEAVSEQGDAPAAPAKVEAVRALVDDAESGAARTEARSTRADVVRKETSASVVFTTEDPTENRRNVHKSYLPK